jgi:hypothetical protein
MNNVTKNAIKRLGSRISSSCHLSLDARVSGDKLRQLIDLMVPRNLGHSLIRIGSPGDGGYLIPDDLEGITHCFSPGVGSTATFELEMYRRGIPSFLADYSVNAPPAELPQCDFEKRYLGAYNNQIQMTMDHWVERKSQSHDIGDAILQMDIESAEYETLLATSPDVLNRFRIIVLELHKLNHLSNRWFLRLVENSLSKLREYFEVAHLHPNNNAGLTWIAGFDIPRTLEITLLRKDRVRENTPVACLPHPLDSPTVLKVPDIRLPEYWWQ